MGEWETGREMIQQCKCGSFTQIIKKHLKGLIIGRRVTNNILSQMSFYFKIFFSYIPLKDGLKLFIFFFCQLWSGVFN